MTLRHGLYTGAALLLTAIAPSVRGQTGASPVVSLNLPEAAAVGRTATVVCLASDAEGLATLTITTAGADGVQTVLTSGAGVTSVAGQWTPAAPGAHTVRCEAVALSGARAIASRGVTVTGAVATGPVISELTVPWSGVIAGKTVTLSAAATSSTAGALRYQWSATAGALSAAGALATWTAPAKAGPCTLTVTVTDAAGATATRSATVDVALSVYQDALPVALRGPRRIAATPEGELFVADADGRLHRLTRRGERVSTSLQGVTAVAAGAGVVFAGLSEGAVLQVDARTGRVLHRFELGTREGPTGIAYDAARGRLWLTFLSGTVQVRALDGAQAAVLTKAGSTSMRRLVDVSVDAAGKVWVVADRQGADGTVFCFDATTFGFVRSLAATASAVKVSGGLHVSGGQVFVSDIFSGKVQVLDGAGAAVGSLGSFGVGPGKLRQPAGLARMANGDLLVADMDTNRIERFGASVAVPTCAGDADCDGLPDDWESANGFDGRDPTNAVADADGDGLNETEEFAAGTNPHAGDSDGDGYSDRDELATGYDPANGDDHRPRLLASGPAAVNPGLVRLSSTLTAPDASACATQWQQVAGPRVTLGDSATATPSFVARRAGTYRFRASAACGGVASLPATVSLDVRNVAPTPDGGRALVVPQGGTILLESALSSDANGDALAFAWDQLLGAPAIGSVAGPAAEAQFAQPGYYVFRLGASDGRLESGAEVPVVVLGAEPIPVARVATPVVARIGAQVVLDGSASLHGAGAELFWTQVDGAPVALDGASSVAAAFVAPAPGRYAFDLTVAEGGVRSPPARVEVFVAPAEGALPVARASAPAVVAVGAPFALDGAASSGSRFAWRQVDGPAAGLNDADAAVATAVPFGPGSLVFELTAADGEAVGVPVRVRVEARAGGRPIPVAAAVAPAAAAVGERVLLDGSGSAGATGFRWTQVDGPWVVVEQGPVGAFTPAAPGTYGFELEVDDGQARSAPARVNVVVSQNGMEN